MKNDKLEQFVRDHAEGFDTLEPPVMAWNAIQGKLPVTRRPAIVSLRQHAWKVAAAVFIFAAAWMLNDYYDRGRQNDHLVQAGDAASSPALSELSDAEAFYASQISNRQAELEKYAREHPEIIEDLKEEFREMDKKKAALKDDLAESNADEKVIEAIILSYRVKLEILDQMLTELKETSAPQTKREPADTEL